MLKVAMAKWGQTVEDLRLASLNQTHPRSRERFQALYLMASGQFNATTCAAHIGRADETVLAWVHLYNERGPAALTYHRTGGSAPLLPQSRWKRSSEPSSRPSRSTTACPDTSGRSRSSAPGC